MVRKADVVGVALLEKTTDRGGSGATGIDIWAEWGLKRMSSGQMQETVTSSWERSSCGSRSDTDGVIKGIVELDNAIVPQQLLFFSLFGDPFWVANENTSFPEKIYNIFAGDWYLQYRTSNVLVESQQQQNDSAYAKPWVIMSYG